MNQTNNAATHPLSRVDLDMDALAHNWKTAEERCSRGTKLIAVVKADAYGHGATTVARALSGNAAAFAVAQPMEGVALRKAGISDPVLVLCPPEQHWAGLYAQWNLQAVVGDMGQFPWLPQGIGIHLKFDTGMNRIGFRPEQAGEIFEAVKRHTGLNPVGLMSHFANADQPGHSSIRRQLDAFNAVSSLLPSEWTRHLANTAAFNTLPESHFDAARIGLMLCGYMPNGLPDPGLKPVKRWTAPITQVRSVKAGEPVSYGWTWETPADGWLGVVPVGYADGYPRALSGNASVDLEDGPAVVAGRVTMDYLMVWTDRRALRSGETATLLGGPTTGADRLAKAAGSISYEVLCTTGHVRQPENS